VGLPFYSFSNRDVLPMEDDEKQEAVNNDIEMQNT